MKRFITAPIILFIILTLAGCGQYGEEMETNEENLVDAYEPQDTYEEKNHSPYEQEEEMVIFDTPVEDSIRFSSVEDFLNAYMIASAGGNINHLASEWHETFAADGAPFSTSAAAVNFTSLETFYLPVGIPEEFELFTIEVNEELVSFIFLHSDDMVSEDAIWDAIRNLREFRFTFYRWDVEDSVLIDAMLEQNFITEEDLIDGKYLLHEQGRSFSWVFDRTRFHLRTPWLHHNARAEVSIASENGDMPLADPLEAVKFTEMVTLNLQDTRAVEAMIAELEAARR